MKLLKNIVDWYTEKTGKRVTTETSDVYVQIDNVNTHLVRARITNKHTGALRKVSLGTFARVQMDPKGNTIDCQIVEIGRAGFEAVYFSDDTKRHVEQFAWVDLLFTFEW